MSGATPDPPERWIEAQPWFAKATEDLQMAQLAMGVPVPLIEPAAYHCQQATEKLLKGLLIGCGIGVPRTHDLERLARLLDERVPEVTADVRQLVVLTPWAEITR